MPIAPTHAQAPVNAPGAGPARPVSEDDAALDAFTALLLAAAETQDEAASDDAPTDAAAADAAGQPPALDAAALLALPLPASGDRLPVTGTAATEEAGAGGKRRAGTASAAPAAAAIRKPAGEGGDATATADATNVDAASAVAGGAIAVLPGQEPAAGTVARMEGARPDRLGRQAVSPAGSAPAHPLRSAVAAAGADAKPANGALAHLPGFSATADAGPDAARATNADLPASTSVWHAGAHPGTPSAASATPAHVVVETVHAPAFTPGWQDETVASLAHVVLGRHERAELKLNPAELGPVSIRVDMQADQASVSIVAASPDTRSALEQSLPQLRDLLASQGITLAQADVHDGSRERDAPAPGWPQPDRADVAAGHASVEVAPFIRARPNRLVDVFA
jgi:flagellar hook-length control protein FliK